MATIITGRGADIYQQRGQCPVSADQHIFKPKGFKQPISRFIHDQDGEGVQ